MLIFSFRRVQCFLAALLALPILAGNAAERRAGDCQPPKTCVLRISQDFLALVAAAGRDVAPVDAAYYPTLPVDPLDAVIGGRLQTQQGATEWTELESTLFRLTAKVAAKQREALFGAVDAAAGTAAEAPQWLLFLTERLRSKPQGRVGWVHLVDPLHAIALSRIHFLIYDEASLAGSPPAPTWRHFIMDLGSLNGIYLNNVRIPADLSVPLRPGDRLRFASLTKVAKAYLTAIRVGSNLGVSPNFSGLVPLQAKDLHMEYEFVTATAEESLAARNAWLHQALQPHPSAHAQALAPQPGPAEVPAVAAASAQPAAASTQPAPAQPARVQPASAVAANPPGEEPMEVVPDAEWVDLDREALSPEMEKKALSRLPSTPSLVLPKALACGLCRELMVDPVVLVCGDSFCLDCAQTWLREHPDGTCPLCHQPHRGPVVTNPLLMQAVDGFERQLDPAMRAARAEQVARRRAKAAGSDQAPAK